MLDCTKTYKMVLTDDDGNIYKSNNVEIRDANVYFTGRDIDKFAEIKLVMRRLRIEEAETPPEMPLATVAATASKIIQEEKRKAAIEKEWTRLTEEVCKAVKAGDEKIFSRVIFEENKERLEKMGYYLVMSNAGVSEYRIAWAGIYMDLHRD